MSRPTWPKARRGGFASYWPSQRRPPPAARNSRPPVAPAFPKCKNATSNSAENSTQAMNSTLAIVLLAFGVAAAVVQNLGDPRQQLAGKWTCTTATIDGSPLAAETAKILTLTLTADRFKTQ